MKQILTLLTLVFAVTMTLFIASGSAHAVNDDVSQQQAQNVPLNPETSCALAVKKV
ncbi:hypothetical protein [Thiomicrorhabdus arctica]|jgi:hypothetical protein|uniref:hypothetical protein n=1 Tax=Thiomicrorhabdus arctica TaxID=131540 RepID=UPI0003716783|nr:hypothetical protein [Thiomicrorhabdus arctica]